LSAFDIFLLVPISYGAFQGFRRGLLLEVISLGALLIGIIGGLKLLNQALPVMRSFVGDVYGLLPFVTFLLVFAGIILAVRLLGLFLKTAVDFTPFGLVDNVLGSILGGLKWSFALSLLLYVSGLAGMAVSEETAQASLVYPKLVLLTPLALKGIGVLLPFVKNLLHTLRSHF
jgi:membrane protein required for colicin V production